MASFSTGPYLVIATTILFGSCGKPDSPPTNGQQTYSFRSDPDSEFISFRYHGGMSGGFDRLVTYSDGRYRFTYSDGQGRSVEVFETRLTAAEMGGLLEVIVDSGLMTHDHRKAKIGEYRNPTGEVLVYDCSDCASFSFTIQLAENNCPGRRPNAPITVEVAPVIWTAKRYPHVPELQASAQLWRILSDYKKRVEQARPRS